MIIHSIMLWFKDLVIQSVCLMCLGFMPSCQAEEPEICDVPSLELPGFSASCAGNAFVFDQLTGVATWEGDLAARSWQSKTVCFQAKEPKISQDIKSSLWMWRLETCRCSQKNPSPRPWTLLMRHGSKTPCTHQMEVMANNKLIGCCEVKWDNLI